MFEERKFPNLRTTLVSSKQTFAYMSLRKAFLSFIRLHEGCLILSSLKSFPFVPQTKIFQRQQDLNIHIDRTADSFLSTQQ